MKIFAVAAMVLSSFLAFADAVTEEDVTAAVKGRVALPRDPNHNPTTSPL